MLRKELKKRHDEGPAGTCNVIFTPRWIQQWLTDGSKAGEQFGASPWSYSKRKLCNRSLFGRPPCAKQPLRSYAPLPGEFIVERGQTKLVFVNLLNGAITPIDTQYTDFSRLRRADEKSVVFIASTAFETASLIRMTINTSSPPSFEVLVSPNDQLVSRHFITPAISYKIPKANGEYTYANFLPPKNPQYLPLKDEKPPCILYIHAGSTNRCKMGIDLFSLLSTSRGFAL